MASAFQAEAMREKRAESLGRRPSVAVAGAPGADEKKFAGRKKLAEACQLAVDRISPDPNQLRREFDPEAIERLAASLKARGQLQPVRVRRASEIESYVIIVGERRWRAATMIGLETLDCVVVDGEMTPEDLLEDQLVENALREDLKPVEQARSYRALMDAKGLTHRELAERLNVAHTTVTRALGLLELPESVQVQVDGGGLSSSTAYTIASNLEDESDQREVAERVVSEGLSRAATAEVIRQVAASKPAKAGAKQGRGVAKPKKLPTAKTIRTAAGTRVTVENRKGVDDSVVMVALREILANLEAQAGVA
jgi:ParB family transcriptional regulator, chromosome partitioning protein